MSIKVVRDLRFPESSFLGFPDTHLNWEDAPYSGANESKCQGDHKWQLKCLPASLAQLKKELYNSPLTLTLEERLILHIRSSVKHSSGSYASTSETSDQTVAQCQDKLQQLLSIMCSYGVFIQQSFIITFLKLYSNSVHFKKRRSIEQVKKTTLDMQSEPWSPHYRFCTNFSHFCLMTRFLWKYETICPVFKNHSCSLFFHRILPRILSTNTVFFLLSAIFPITVESQLLTSQGLSRDLLTVSSIRRLEEENATFWSAKNIAKFFFWPKSFCSGISYVLNNRKTRKIIRFSGTFNK